MQIIPLKSRSKSIATIIAATCMMHWRAHIPVVKLLVGDDFFRFLAKRYIEQHPSRSANLHHFGSELAGFIAAFEPAKELVYLADVAALEWACHVAYFADDENALDIDKLAQVTPEQYSDLVLHTHPSCRVVRSRYPVAAIWHAHQPGAPEDFHHRSG